MPKNGLSLLLVDDDVPLRFLFMRILDSLGYEMKVAQDGFSALRCLKERRFDVLLSDLNMPGMSGFELLSVVRRRFRLMHVIAMSGSYPGKEVPAGVAADAYYEKGNHPDELLTLLEQMPLQKTLPRCSRTPLPAVWIAQNDQSGESQHCITITCPDCLRAFRQRLRPSKASVQRTSCVHCSAGVRYAIVEHAESLRSHVQLAGQTRADLQ